MYGKTLRLARLINPVTRRTCMVPIDHGTTIGPVEGIQNYLHTIRQVVAGGADAVILHKGVLSAVSNCPELAKGRYIMHLSVSTVLGPDPTYKVLASTVEEAVKLGADGVSVHVNLGTATENEMIKDLGMVAESCLEWGMPLLAMIYAHKSPKETFHLAHAARLAEELGADLVKIDTPNFIEDIDKIVAGVSIPVIIAGGAALNSAEELLIKIDKALTAGAAGVAIGRNVFKHKYPRTLTEVISRLVHNKMPLSESMSWLKESVYNQEINPELILKKLG